MTRGYTVTLLQEAVEDVRRLEDFAIARELASETSDWTSPLKETPGRPKFPCPPRGAGWAQPGPGGAGTALDAIREGMRWLSCSPYTCRRAELGNGRSRELIVPFGGSGYVVLFEIVGSQVIVGAVRHQREEEYRR